MLKLKSSRVVLSVQWTTAAEMPKTFDAIYESKTEQVGTWGFLPIRFCTNFTSSSSEDNNSSSVWIMQCCEATRARRIASSTSLRSRTFCKINWLSILYDHLCVREIWILLMASCARLGKKTPPNCSTPIYCFPQEILYGINLSNGFNSRFSAVGYFFLESWAFCFQAMTERGIMQVILRGLGLSYLVENRVLGHDV